MDGHQPHPYALYSGNGSGHQSHNVYGHQTVPGMPHVRPQMYQNKYIFNSF